MNHRTPFFAGAVSLIAAVACIAVPACTKHKGAAAKKTEASAPTAKKSTARSPGTAARAKTPAAGATAAAPEAAAANKGATVTLVNPGNSPRQQLRYQLKVGDKEGAVLSMNVQMAIKMPNMPTPKMKLPGMRMHMNVGVGKRVDAHNVRYTFELTKADVIATKGAKPQWVAGMKAGLAHVNGVKGSATVDDRGFNRDVEIELPKGMPPQMRQMIASTKQSIEQMCSPLPAKPVGVGAEWKVQQVIKQNGMALHQTTLFKLLKISGHTVTLGATIQQHAAHQKIQMPGIPSRSGTELVSLTSKGAGKVHLDFTKLAPTKSHIAMTSDSSFQMSLRGQSHKMKMHMTSDISIARKKWYPSARIQK